MTVLDNIYYDIKHPGSFSSAQVLYNHAKQAGYKGGIKSVKRYLKNQDAYTLHRKSRLKFDQRKTITKGIDSQWQADLVVLNNIAKYNKNYRFLLTVVDVFSRHAWVQPLKTKSASDVVGAFQNIFSRTDRRPAKLQTDEGLEFFGAKARDFFKKHQIIHFASNSPHKASLVERLNRTLLTKLYRYFTAKETLKYLDVLQDLVTGYNLRKHRSLGIAPVMVTKKNEKKLWNKLYKGNIRSNKPFKFQTGESVRLTKNRRLFKKGYLPKWTHEYFFITDRIKSKPHTYRITDLKKEVIKGIFYEQELQSVEIKHEHRFPIDILRKRSKQGKTEFLVHYRGWPKGFDEWISEQNLTPY